MNDLIFILGIVGVRGYIGVELIKLVVVYSWLKLVFVFLCECVGQCLFDYYLEFQGELQYENLDVDVVVVKGVDVVILVLFNGLVVLFVVVLEVVKVDIVIVDFLVDYCFDNSWYYGLLELIRGCYNGQKYISNLGCYVMVMQLVVYLLLDLLVGLLQCFGVFGYFGVGIMLLDKNNVELLVDNLMLYVLINYVYECEVLVQLGVVVEFMLYVVLYFCGIMLIVNLWLNCVQICEQIVECFQQVYVGELLIEVVDEVLWVSCIVGCYGVQVGGFMFVLGGKCVVVVVILDNLLKGVVIQVMQNFNFVLGIDELMLILY